MMFLEIASQKETRRKIMRSAANCFARTVLAALTFTFIVAMTPIDDAVAEVEVKVRNFEFAPRDIVIPMGEVVKWSWESGTHTTTNGTGSSDPDAGMLWDEPMTSSDPTFSYQFNEEGFFPYFCIPHELLDMKGTVTVEAPAGVGDNAEGNSGPIPSTVGISQNYPNPFNPSTTFTIDLPGGETRNSTLRIYNLRGAVIKTILDRQLAGGSYSFAWDGRTDRGEAAPSGIYIYRLQYGREVITRKMTMLK